MNIFPAQSAFKYLEQGKEIAVLQGYAIRLVKADNSPGNSLEKVLYTKLAHEKDWHFLTSKKSVVLYNRRDIHQHLVPLQPSGQKKASSFIWHEWHKDVKIQIIG